MSQARITRSQFRYNKKQVLFLTAMTEDQYNNFQIDTAKAWVERFWQSMMDGEALLTTTVFWYWWLYEWNRVDDRKIIHEMYITKKHHRLSRYRSMHQYVFDEQDEQHKIMMIDFRNMRTEFDRAIKQPTLI